MPNKKSFLITIDTEGDNLWGQGVLTTKNARFLDRFQTLCERYGFKPCYLTNHEMAIDPIFQQFARAAIARGTAEIGMHLHAWNSPPDHPETDAAGQDKAYLIEYPAQVMRSKVDYLTKLLEDVFGTKMLSHRAGRWAFNHLYAEILLEYGYQVDCSVTPHVDWSQTLGTRTGRGGSDYRDFPEEAYFVDLADISQPGQSGLLEIPMSIRPKYPAWIQGTKSFVDRLRGKNRPASMSWLRPKRGNARQMMHLADQILDGGANYAEFMLHSSELMPGGSPTFTDEASIEHLYTDLDTVFKHLAARCQGSTLAEYRQSLSR